MWSSRERSLLNNKRLTSAAAYSNVKSRIDSGLGRLTIASRSRSHTELRNNNNDEHRTRAKVVATTTTVDTIKYPVEMLALFREAKEEIANLKQIVQQQQMLIDILMRREDGGRAMTKTMATTMTTTRTSKAHQQRHQHPQLLINGHGHADCPPPVGHNNDNNEAENETITELWQKYQQILAHKQSTENVSANVRRLIEKLYQALQEAQMKIVQLSAPEDTSACPQLNTILDQHQKQIELCRKENVYLQNSLSQFVKQMINCEPGQNGSAVVDGHSNHNHNHRQDNEYIRMKTEIKQLRTQLSEQDELCRQYRQQHENMVTVNEADQLRVKHLEAKVRRLSDILFDGFGRTTTTATSKLDDGDDDGGSKHNDTLEDVLD